MTEKVDSTHMERIRLELEILGSELESGNLKCRRKPAIQPPMNQRNLAVDVSIEEAAKPSASAPADSASTAAHYAVSRGTFDRFLHRLRTAALVLLQGNRSIDNDRPDIRPQETDDVTRLQRDRSSGGSL